jgi:hypothetical protein
MKWAFERADERGIAAAMRVITQRRNAAQLTARRTMTMNRIAALLLATLMTLTAACAADSEPTGANDGTETTSADGKKPSADQGDVPVIQADGTVTVQRMVSTWKCCRVGGDGSMTCSSTRCP